MADKDLAKNLKKSQKRKKKFERFQTKSAT